MSNRVVIGIFNDYETARHVLEALREADISPDKLSVVGSDPEELRMATVDLQDKGPDKSITVGGFLGAIGGWVAGLTAMSIPGAGQILVAGPLLAAISGAAAGGFIGSLVGALVHFDVPNYVAEVYQGHISQGNVLIAVHSQDHEERTLAEDIMDRFGAIEIDLRSEPQATVAGKTV